MAELYRFELKKCLQQKVLWITGGILLLCLCLWGAAACLQTTDSGLRGEEIIRLHREGGAALAGETVDQDMLDQFRPAYEKMVVAGDARELMGCIDLYEFLGHVLDTAASAEILAVDQQMLYDRLEDKLRTEAEKGSATEQAASYWQSKVQQQLSQPLVYGGYHEGWSQMASLMKVMTFLEVLFLSVALSGMFPQEAQHRTDQLILSSRRGRTALYTGKLLAGLTVGVGFGLLHKAHCWGSPAVWSLWAGGPSRGLALFTCRCPWGHPSGQVTLLLFGAFLAGGGGHQPGRDGALPSDPEQCGHHGNPGGDSLLTTLITAVPESPRLLSVLWYLLPSNFVSLQGRFAICSQWGALSDHLAGLRRLPPSLALPALGGGVYTAGTRWAPDRNKTARNCLPRLL